MATRTYKILCVHGVGRHEPGGRWEKEWSRDIRRALAGLDGDLKPKISFAHYDDLFETRRISALDVIGALGKLGWSGLTAMFRGGARGLRSRTAGARLKWTAGMVVEWVEDKGFRAKLAARVRKRIEKDQPDMIMAHSLGSLICYDIFSEKSGAKLIENRIFVTFGSQIGNPFVCGNFAAGRILALSGARFWFHLYNRFDDVFTARIRLSARNFVEIDTPFNHKGWGDHSPSRINGRPGYLAHPETVEGMWAEVALSRRKSATFALNPVSLTTPRGKKESLQWAVTDSFRALLIGIDAYPAPDMQLEGCRNDVFLVSELLQELGLPAGSVRVLLDSRATAAAIRERMEWLLEGVGENDERFLFFSGHGAQIPGYGLGEVVDRRDEVLVPWDFDWTRQNAIHDDGFYELYSNLPYSSRFTAVFDCCHAGGMTRDGSMRVRGLNPPDDIRHRVMAWQYRDRSKRKDPDEWDLRKLELPANQIYRHINQLPPPGRSGAGSAYCSTHRLGQAMTLREYGPGGRDRFKKLAKSRGHRGPYMPTLWYACQEREFAMEYRQGSASYGTFTWSFVRLVREIRKQQEIRSASQIEKQLQARVQAINPNQLPHLIAPSAIKRKPPSWILPQ